MTQLEELKASGLLLDLGVSVPIRPLGFLYKKRRRSLTMRTPGLGGMIRIARQYLALGITMEEVEKFTFEQQMEFIAQHGKEVSRMVAYTIVRGAVLGRLLNRPVAWWLRWRVHPAYLGEAMIQVLTQLDITSFFTTIRSAQAMNVMTRRLSQ